MSGISNDEWPFTRETAATEAEQWALVQAQLAAAERRGYDRAVANLRDLPKIAAWFNEQIAAGNMDAFDESLSPAADYLESLATKETDR